MKKVLLAVAVLGALFLTPNRAKINQAECAWCYSGDCINNSICGSGCVCIKRGFETFGYCASINRQLDLNEYISE